MPPTTPPAEDVLASCSFCGKPDTTVQRLVAGPGVHICNECVELAVWVVEDAARATPEEAARRRSEYRARPPQDVLPALADMVRSADRIEGELTAWIKRLREQGIDWPTIAGAAGMSVDAARRRFDASGPASS